ncbi:MAG: acetoacetate--CoA ligase [Bacteroidota bacterium]
MTNSGKVLWTPSQEFVEQSNLAVYQRWLAQQKGLEFHSYSELWQWTVEDLPSFWGSLWEYFQIVHGQTFDEVLSQDNMPNVEWFSGATVNYAAQVFQNRSQERPALIFQNEEGRSELSWETLEKKVRAVQAFLIQNGIGKGDCVAAYLPNIPEAIICFLAVNSIGGVWSCCSPDFGVDTVIERFAQIQPRLLITVDGYRYGGKSFSRLPEVEKIKGGLPSLERCVFIPYLDSGASLSSAQDWDEVLNTVTTGSLAFTFVPFDHPIWVLYSSGTTGKPKAITHSHGGVLIEHLKYLSFHNDVHPGERFFWFTTTGWMMWNFLQASLLVGATPVLFDGSPGYPSLEVLWRMTSELSIQHFGTSAPFLTTCMKQGLDIGATWDVSKLRSIGSTGAPLPPEAFEWVYNQVSDSVWLCSMSGGTDVCTAFVGGNPYMPVQKGRIQSRALGCALYGYDDAGSRIEESLGEMVIEQPMPSMPIYFWNDPDNKRYTKSYFDMYSGKWRHGDWIYLYADGSLIIQGRSDATLNRKGIRIGTAEIYRIVDKIPGIQDSLILNLEQEGGEDVMPLFVVLKEGFKLTDELQSQIKRELKSQGSPRHVPDLIYTVPDIPYTLSGKKMEVPVKKVLMKMHSTHTMNLDAIRNPEAMDYFLKQAGNFGWD